MDKRRWVRLLWIKEEGVWTIYRQSCQHEVGKGTLTTAAWLEHSPCWEKEGGCQGVRLVQGRWPVASSSHTPESRHFPWNGGHRDFWAKKAHNQAWHLEDTIAAAQRINCRRERLQECYQAFLKASCLSGEKEITIIPPVNRLHTLSYCGWKNEF